MRFLHHGLKVAPTYKLLIVTLHHCPFFYINTKSHKTSLHHRFYTPSLLPHSPPSPFSPFIYFQCPVAPKRRPCNGSHPGQFMTVIPHENVASAAAADADAATGGADVTKSAAAAASRFAGRNLRTIPRWGKKL